MYTHTYTHTCYYCHRYARSIRFYKAGPKDPKSSVRLYIDIMYRIYIYIYIHISLSIYIYIYIYTY